MPRRERVPTPAAIDPLRLQVAREVGLVPGLQELDARQHASRQAGIGKAAVIAASERCREVFQSSGARRPASRIGVWPASGSFRERRRVKDDEQRRQARRHRAEHARIDSGEAVGGTRGVARLEARRGHGRRDVPPVDGDPHDRRASSADARERQRAYRLMFVEQQTAVGDRPRQARVGERSVEQRSVLGEHRSLCRARRGRARGRRHAERPRRTFRPGAGGHGQDRRGRDPDERRECQPE